MMEEYAPFLTAEDSRLKKLFDVRTEFGDGPFVDDPYPAFERLRREGPVHRGSPAKLIGLDEHADDMWETQGIEVYSAYSFETCNYALIENELFSSEAFYRTAHVVDFLGDTILNKVGAEHRSYRDALQPIFKPSYVQNWWGPEFIEPAADILVSHFQHRGRGDLLGALTSRMPFYVTSAAFGVPADQALPFRMAMDEAGEGDDLGERMSGSAKAVAMLEEIVEERRTQAQDDIISRMLATERALPDGSKCPLNTQEIIDHTRVTVFAGGGTTWRQMGITLFALLDHPETLAEVRDSRDLMAQAVLEAARWNATDPVFSRMTTADTEFGGVKIPAGSVVNLCFGAANRDDARWEDPDAFDIHRPIQRSLTFAGGPHSCLGQHVARNEMEVAVGLALDRLPGLRWDPDELHPVITGGMIGRGATALPVVWNV
jgi:cytochrome P450